MIKSFEEIVLRDLSILKNEVNSFKNDENLWILKGEIKNTAGNLSLHLCGNLQHFIGAWLGQTGYVRDRDKEFSAKGLGRDQISQLIDETIKVVKNTFQILQNADLDSPCPHPFMGRDLTIGELLLILCSHLSYHLGQINYLRRIIA